MMLNSLFKETLIEYCIHKNDTNSISICLQTYEFGEMNLNWKTIGIILQSKETSEIKKILTQYLIKDAKYEQEEFKNEKMRLTGTIKKRFITSQFEYLSDKILEEAIDEKY